MYVSDGKLLQEIFEETYLNVFYFGVFYLSEAIFDEILINVFVSNCLEITLDDAVLDINEIPEDVYIWNFTLELDNILFDLSLFLLII